MTAVFALLDCNNFYVSCERLFQPALLGKPVVVLSNNDGCIIARSDEAKALGIPMGLPAIPAHALNILCDHGSGQFGAGVDHPLPHLWQRFS